MGRELTGHTISQNKLILDHLMKHGSISQYEAANMYDCWRLGARISDLRAKGILIKTEMVHKTNKYGHKIKYGRYSLITAEQEA